MMVRIRITFIAVFLVMGLGACVTMPPPIEDYALAKAALDAAKAVEAARFSSGFFHRAELSYKKAVSLFEDREYEQAQEEFRRARDAAEKAENSARLLRFKNGEVL
jgi:hypothetical protein